MRLRGISSIAIVLLCGAFSAPSQTDEDLNAGQIVKRMIEQEEKNAELAAQYQYEQETVTEKLNSDDEVVKSRTKTSQQRLQKHISYKVQGIRGGKEVETEVGFGAPVDDKKKEEGTYVEAMTIRELSNFYEFEREDDENIDGVDYYVLAFAPKDPDELPKTKSREEKVLAHLHGELLVHPVDFSIVRSRSELVSPIPFAIIDLVSLRDLTIQYEAFKVENKVWLPQKMEVSYKVRVLYLSNIRERQRVTMRNHRKVEQAVAEDDPDKSQAVLVERARVEPVRRE